MIKRIGILAGLGAALALLSGCAGYDLKSQLPDSINKLAVPVFKNVSGQPGVEQDLTTKVTQGFNVDGRLVVVDQAQADALLEGVIQTYNKIPLLRDENQVPVQYKLLIAVDLTLSDLKAKKVMWTTHTLVATQGPGDSGLQVGNSKAYDSTNVATIEEYTTYYVLNKMGMPPEEETTARNRVLDQLVRRIVDRVIFGF
jgi:hypothetical protein